MKKNASFFKSLDSRNLSSIHNDGISYVILKRELSDSIHRSISFAKELNLQFQSDYLSLKHNVETKMRESYDLLKHLFLDTMYCAELYRMVSGKQNFRIKLNTVSSVTCPRFHCDFTVLRMLCTYTGQSTQFIDRKGRDFGFPVNETLISKEEIISSGTGNIMIMKGEKYQNNSGNGLIHRSPSAGEQRILLVIDE